MDKYEKAVKKIAAIAISIFLLGISFVGGYYTRYFTLTKEVRTYMWVMQQIKDNYYQDTLPSELLDISLKSLIGELDRYCEYYTQEEYAQIIKEREGERSGFGITMHNSADKCVIFSVSGNSPAQRANLKRGDTLIGMGESSDAIIDFDGYESAVEKIKAVKSGKMMYFKLLDGEIVTMAKEVFEESFVFYGDDSGYFGFEKSGKTMQLTQISTKDELLELDDKTAYIKLTSFNGNAAGQFASALLKFKANNKSRLILDLRDNGGGYMDILINICEHLVYSDTQYLYAAIAKYKDGRQITYPLKNSFYKDYNFENMAVLANGYTASASECLIGALVEYNSVEPENIFISKYEGIENPTTYGKGIMQTTVTNEWGGALKLTTAQILRPISKTSIHGIGISGTAIQTADNTMFSIEDNELKAAISKMAA